MSLASLKLSRFDHVVISFLLGILLLTGFVIWRGDQLGLEVVAFSPTAEQASTQAIVQIIFNEPLDPATEPALSLEPPVTGTISFERETLTFWPAQPLSTDMTYRVSLTAGVVSERGRRLLQPVTWEFRTRQSRILYLGLDASEQNQIYVSEIPAGGQGTLPTQLTEAPFVVDFSVAPDGSAIVYTILRDDGGSDLWIMAADGSNQRKLLACVEAACSNTSWSPDGRRIIYEWRNIPTPGAPPGAPRLWWLDADTGETVPVFQDSQLLGLGARLSADGRWLSFVSPIDQGIQVYNLEDGSALLISNQMGSPAVWNPQDNALLMSNISLSEEQWAVYLEKVDVESEERTPLSQQGDVDDSSPAWSPDGEWIAFGRKQPRTPMGRQLWLMRADGSDPHALTNDADVHYGPFAWSPDGRYILLQRYDLAEPYARAAIGLLEVGTGIMREVAAPGTQPAWLP